MKNFLGNDQKTLLVGAVLAAIAFWYLKDKAVEGAKAVGNAIDPTNNENIFNKGVSAVGTKLTGIEDFSFGSWIYDKFNPEPVGSHAESQTPVKQPENKNKIPDLLARPATQSQAERDFLDPFYKNFPWLDNLPKQ